MIAQDEPGHVVNTASIAGLTSGAGLPIYGASKHAAVVRISEALHQQLAEAGSKVKASVLCPGGVRTRIALAARNRPDELWEGKDRPTEAEFEAREAEWRTEPARPEGAGRVANRVLAAIKEEQFYILTHDEYDGRSGRGWKRSWRGETPGRRRSEGKSSDRRASRCRERLRRGAKSTRPRDGAPVSASALLVAEVEVRDEVPSAVEVPALAIDDVSDRGRTAWASKRYRVLPCPLQSWRSWSTMPARRRARVANALNVAIMASGVFSPASTTTCAWFVRRHGIDRPVTLEQTP